MAPGLTEAGGRTLTGASACRFGVLATALLLAACHQGGLVAMADDLNLQVTRIEGHRQAVESIEARLNALKTLSDNVDRKLKEQLGGRAGVDGKLREGLSSRIAATDR